MSLEAAPIALRPRVDCPSLHLRPRAKISVGACGHACALNRRRRDARPHLELAAGGGRRFRQRPPSLRSRFCRRRKSSHLHRRRGEREAVLGFRASRHDQLPCPAGSGRRVPLVPYCVHLVQEGECPGNVYRYDLESNRYRVVVEGRIELSAGSPYFRSTNPEVELRPGDQVAPLSSFQRCWAGRRLYRPPGQRRRRCGARRRRAGSRGSGREAMLAFPDEEEGPVGAGNQTMCRGSARIEAFCRRRSSQLSRMSSRAGRPDFDTRGGVENSTRLGGGAVLSEFSSLARGAVTPSASMDWLDAWRR